MLFNSIQFLIFLPIVLAVYFIIPAKVRHYWLLAASYFFYMCWNARYAVLIFISTLITYLSGRFLERIKNSDLNETAKTRRKKCIVAISFVSNLSILFFFKYINFVLSIFAQVFSYANIQLNLPQFDILLPVGISFYTFQALGYTMDVYRNEIYAEKDFFKYALFVSFFPQLVAGPIERSKNLLSQLSVPKKFSYDDFREGVLLMLWGYFLKLVIADRAAVFVDTVYSDHAAYPGSYLIVATMLFAIQIYCDFAGYSIIAAGSAKMLGIRLTENFNAPYLADSVADFWRRWHISLTSWFKDYLYIPLGGSRRGQARKYLNKLIVFLASGLWHGASFSFVIWGGLNGIYQIIGEILLPVRTRVIRRLNIHPDLLGYRLLRIICTAVMVDFSWIFFRAQRVGTALKIIKSIFTVRNPWILFDGSLYECGLNSHNFSLLLVSIGLLLFCDCCKLKGIVIRRIIERQDCWFRCIFIALAVLFIMTFGKYGPAYDAASFIYFQF